MSKDLVQRNLFQNKSNPANFGQIRPRRATSFFLPDIVDIPDRLAAMAAGQVSQQQLRLEARLRPELIDPCFEGYKLSLDPLATFQVSTS